MISCLLKKTHIIQNDRIALLFNIVIDPVNDPWCLKRCDIFYHDSNRVALLCPEAFGKPIGTVTLPFYDFHYFFSFFLTDIPSSVDRVRNCCGSYTRQLRNFLHVHEDSSVS